MTPQRRALALLLCASGCGGSTGNDRVTFSAAAAGPSDATGQSLAFDNSVGYHVVLTRARVHIGSVYLNQAVPSSGAQETGCILPGIYVGQVLSALDVDTLSPVPQLFATPGDGTATPARAGELWLTGGPVDAATDATVILDAAGTATGAAGTIPFVANLTIGANRAIPATDPAFPGANPICKQRIVGPIPVDLTLRQGGQLLVRIDPRAFFVAVDFSSVPKVSDALYQFADSSGDSADINLYSGLRNRTTAYQFTFQ